MISCNISGLHNMRNLHSAAKLFCILKTLKAYSFFCLSSSGLQGKLLHLDCRCDNESNLWTVGEN